MLINSTLTAASKFTKTSSKFGQWIDHAASTVYGLGFDKEDDLDKVCLTAQWDMMCCVELNFIEDKIDPIV